MAESIPILNTTRLTLLSNEQTVANWDIISRILAPAIPYTCGRVTLDDVDKAVQDDLAAVVIAWDPLESDVYAAFVCEIELYPTGCKCWKITLAGGRDIREWSHLWPVLKQIGKDQGCNQVELVGRPGWFKVLQLSEVSRVHIEDI